MGKTSDAVMALQKMLNMSADTQITATGRFSWYGKQLLRCSYQSSC
jgi:hypothetical protein